MSNQRDNLYAEPLLDPGLFTFDDSVASVFPDMIKRSVPGYTTIIAMTGLLAGRYASPGSRLYDLGCSLGASTLAMRQNNPPRDCHIVAVDNSAAMLERCRRGQPPPACFRSPRAGANAPSPPAESPLAARSPSRRTTTPCRHRP